MASFVVRGWWDRDLPLEEVGPETPGRWAYDSACYGDSGLISYAIAGHGQLQIHRPIGKGHVCCWIGTKAPEPEPADSANPPAPDSIAGVYLQNPPSAYNPIGAEKVSIVLSVAAIAPSDYLDRRRDAVAAVCHACPDGLFRAFKGRYVVDCATRRCGPCGGVSVNHTCPKGHWETPLSIAGLLRHSELTPSTLVEVVGRVLHQPPGEWPRGFYNWENVKEAHRRHFAEFRRELIYGERGVIERPPSFRNECGIVVVGGGPYFDSAYVTIRVIQHLGYKGDIWLAHLDEVTREQRQVIEDMGVKCVNVPAMIRTRAFPPARRLTGWSLKAYIALCAPWRYVHVRDADSYPIHRPDRWFEHPEFVKAGAMFYPDQEYYDLPPHTWEVFKLQPIKRFCHESGQFYIDKGKWYEGLAMMNEIGQHGDWCWSLPGEELRESWRWWGDKDDSNIASHMLGLPYAMSPKRWDVVEQGMIQNGLDGMPDSVHRCRDKFTRDRRKGDGAHSVFKTTAQVDLREKHFSRQSFNPVLPHEKFCHNAIAELEELLPQGNQDAREASVPKGAESRE